jgi:hypothetical protein
MHGLGDSPKGHANKAISLEGSAMKDFKQAVKSGRSCKAAFTLYTNGMITMGEAMAHRSESYGTAPKRDASMEKASEAAYAAIRGCLSDRSLSGLRRRPALGASPLPQAEGIDKKGRKVKLVVKKDRDWDEWQVRAYVNGKFNENETHFAGDKEDALASFADMKSRYGLAGMRKRRK